MTIRVRLFAGLRERAGWAERELDGIARVADVWPALGLGDEPPGLLYAVNQEYADRDRELVDGDEVAVIPPVSGGAFRLSEGPLDSTYTSFALRRHTYVSRGLYYEQILRWLKFFPREQLLVIASDDLFGEPAAVMAELSGDLKSRYELCKVAIAHRVGRVGIGEPSVVIAVSAPHRADALAACKDAIDTLKETVPLWKKEVYEGGEEWIGRGS